MEFLYVGSYYCSKGQPLQGQPLQGQSLDQQPLQGQSLDEQPLQGQSLDGQPLQGQSFQDMFHEVQRQYESLKSSAVQASIEQGEALHFARLKCEDLQSDLQAANDKCDALQSDLQAANNKCDALQSDLQAANNKCDALQSDLQAANDKCDALQSEHAIALQKAQFELANAANDQVAALKLISIEVAAMQDAAHDAATRSLAFTYVPGDHAAFHDAITRAAIEKKTAVQVAVNKAAIEKATAVEAAVKKAAMEKDTAIQAAITQAAIEKDTAIQAVITQAAIEKDTVIAQAAMEKDTAIQAAITQAAMEKDTAIQAAIAQAAMEKDAAIQAAINQAAIQHATQQAAVAQAALEAIVNPAQNPVGYEDPVPHDDLHDDPVLQHLDPELVISPNHQIQNAADILANLDGFVELPPPPRKQAQHFMKHSGGKGASGKAKSSAKSSDKSSAKSSTKRKRSTKESSDAEDSSEDSSDEESSDDEPGPTISPRSQTGKKLIPLSKLHLPIDPPTFDNGHEYERYFQSLWSKTTKGQQRNWSRQKLQIEYNKILAALRHNAAHKPIRDLAYDMASYNVKSSERYDRELWNNRVKYMQSRLNNHFNSSK